MGRQQVDLAEEAERIVSRKLALILAEEEIESKPEVKKLIETVKICEAQKNKKHDRTDVLLVMIMAASSFLLPLAISLYLKSV